MANFADDLGAAIVAVINANQARFAALGVSGSTIHAEYASQNVNYNAGASGRCLVKPLPEEPVEGTEFEQSCQSVFPFDLQFDLVDVFDGQGDAANARTVIYQALRGTFRERGAALFAQLTDSGSNRQGGSGFVRVVETQEEESEDKDKPRVTARLDVVVWVKIPGA